MNFWEKMNRRQAATGKPFWQLQREMASAGGKKAAAMRRARKEKLQKFHEEQVAQKLDASDEIFSDQDKRNIRSQAARIAVALLFFLSVGRSETIKVYATAYSWREPEHHAYGDRNCLGGSLRTPVEGLSQIAVDRRVIPLGSIVEIDGVGRRIATDVGSGIKGLHIDIHFQRLSDVRSWSNRKLRVAILRRGWKA